MKCPSCQSPLQITPEQRGTTIACPLCKKKIKIPPAKKKPPVDVPVAKPAAPPPPQQTEPPAEVPTQKEAAEAFGFVPTNPVPPSGMVAPRPEREAPASTPELRDGPLPMSWQRTRQGLMINCAAFGILALGLIIAISLAFSQRRAASGMKVILPSLYESSLAETESTEARLAAGGMTIGCLVLSSIIMLVGQIRCCSISAKTGARSLIIASTVAISVALLSFVMGLLIFAFAEGRFIALGILEIVRDVGFASGVVLFVLFLTQVAISLQHRNLGMIAASLMVFVVMIPIVIGGIEKLIELTLSSDEKEDVQSVGQTIQVLVIIGLAVTVIWMDWLIYRVFREIPSAYRRGKIH